MQGRSRMEGRSQDGGMEQDVEMLFSLSEQ